MNILILSCGTGGGHNSAAHAVEEELLARGHSVTFLNPYDLCGGKVSGRVDGAYISIAQNAPRAFGAIYRLGNAYRRLPFRSPVYFANAHPAEEMAAYLAEHPMDVVMTTHIFPAEILTYLRSHGKPVPKTVYIATDYACVPFTEECKCDAYVIPSPELREDFESYGIPADKIYPFGIPVSRAFRKPVSREEARAALGLDAGHRYLLVSGGSIGAGKLEKAIGVLLRLTSGTDLRLIVVCGSNTSVYAHLHRQFGDRIILLMKTDRMAAYVRGCDLYFTKPGGLSTTEAAVMEAPLVLLPPIPGCETINRRFYCGHGMALSADASPEALGAVLARLDDPDFWETMHRRQRECIPKDAPEKICDLAESLA